MSAISHHNHSWRFWFVSFLCALILIYLLRDILLPFVAGIVVAYFLDPLCDCLENAGLSRTFATVIVTLFFLSVFLLGLAFILPVFFQQIIKFINILPSFIDVVYQKIDGLRENFSGGFDPDSLIGLKSSLNTGLSSAGRWVTGVVGNVVKGSLALLNLLSLIFITPVVTFYLLRDWDRIVARVDGWLPRAHRATIHSLAREVDDTLAGFIRGQGTVCLILGGFYALGLTLAGLNFGLVIGFVAGILSFIPYVGAVIGLLLSVGLALFQFDHFGSVAIVAVVFFAGQFLEGNILTPKLVGERIGLHPVWVIFGLLAGASLFGFVGVLLAVPAAAVIGVGVRFALNRYMTSTYYTGPSDEK